MTYQETVLSVYQQKKNDGMLSDNLINPTRARLKDACVKKYDSKTISEKDNEILKVFLGLQRSEQDYIQYINEYEDGRFRPLDNLLKKEVENSHVRNLDLLAWLIDFPDRPYSIWATTVNWTDKPNYPPDLLKRIFNFLKKKKVWIASFFLTLTFILIIFSSFSKQCMYWTGEQYLPINCNETVNAAVIPLNKRKVEKLRKITRLDTITKNSIGNIWYAKVKIDSAEFYTDSGEYPLDTRKRLLPVTDYMLEKYVFSKRLQ